MTSDQQDSDLNNSVQKPGTGLNPNADTFFYSKALTPPVDKGWEPEGEFLTNGDLNLQDEAGGGFSSGDSPMSDSPPAPLMDSGLEAGAPPPEFIPADPMVASVDPVPLGLAPEMDESLVGEELVESLEPGGDITVPPMDLVQPPAVISTPVSLHNGMGPGQTVQGNGEGGSGVQVSEASSSPAAPTDLRSQLQTQLEYYFSRDNLVQDHYLQSQMDGDQYVPIATIANFNQVVKLTRNYDFIVEVLKSSKAVQVDETGTKVRPRHNRTVLMLREIPENTPKAEVEALFNHEKCPKLVHCEFAHNSYWYITFNTDEDAASAFCFLRERNVMFRNKPVLARIKAKPLVRPGAGGHFSSKAASQQQQEAPVPFMRQQQAQFPIMAAAMPQFQQQVPQPVPPFHLYNLPTMMPQWPNTAAPTFLDPGAMLTMNGLQATAVKPSTNHNRNMYHPVRPNNRGFRSCYRMGKPHHRPQSISSDKLPDSRLMDRPHTNHLPPTRSSPRSNSHQHASEPLSQPPPFSRSRSEGSTGNSHFNSPMPTSVSAAPTPLVPEESLPLHLPAQPLTNTKHDPVSTSVQHKRGNYRKSRRNEDGAKNSRMNASHGGKDGKPHEPHFELESTSFPPLPGSSNNSASGDAPEGSKLSDVVKGTTRASNPRLEVKAIPSPANTITPSPVVVPATSSTPGHSSSPDCSATSLVMSSVASLSLTVVTSPVVKEPEVTANGGLSNHVHAANASATAVESSTHTSKTSKTACHSSSSAACKSESESSVTSKPTSVSTTPAKVPSVPSSPSPAADTTPARLSYAQMVARKQQAENAARQNSEEGVSPQATPSATRPTSQTTLREQSQTQASASVSASAPPKSASASARPSPKESQRKDFDPKEQRFSGGRGAKENRNGRQPRFDRRRSDRDVKVTAK